MISNNFLKRYRREDLVGSSTFQIFPLNIFIAFAAFCRIWRFECFKINFRPSIENLALFVIDRRGNPMAHTMGVPSSSRRLGKPPFRQLGCDQP